MEKADAVLLSMKNCVSLTFITLSVGDYAFELIFSIRVPLIINLLDYTFIKLICSSVKMIFENVELMIWNFESLTLMNYPLCSVILQLLQMNSESDCTSITGSIELEVFVNLSPPCLTCSID